MDTTCWPDIFAKDESVGEPDLTTKKLLELQPAVKKEIVDRLHSQSSFHRHLIGKDCEREVLSCGLDGRSCRIHGRDAGVSQ